VRVPDAVRTELKARLWRIADQLRWAGLAASDKASLYEQWTRDPTIGGVLARFMDARRVRVYLKDTLLKDYTRERLDDWSRVSRVLRIPSDDTVAETYIKPHGRRLRDGRIVCWGRAEAWRDVLLALHERGVLCDRARPYAAVFLHPVARFAEPRIRAMIEQAATKLGIEKVVWLE
jgi:hypothetical protein